jgi:hypothetical protein
MRKIYRVKDEGNIIHTVKRRKANWIGYIWCRNCRLKHVIEGKIGGGTEVKGRQGRRRKKLLDELNERTVETESGSTRTHTVKKSLWLWTCRENECQVVYPNTITTLTELQQFQIPYCSYVNTDF